MHAVKTRTRRTPATAKDRAQAAAALQRALDRRDNGGATGHELQADGGVATPSW
ncbi:hypothetical protein [Streptacidiphilus jiangxiensis]|uniref:Uncharacterized protein n=1 Tax=Streptacidiphilus jiangxiensis TaxID=235985 RepID=A0A1H7XQ98_STRJI|nr:hypothetical protein [Streptacidiphilus jiangxiensis]SEM36112.1 hypothetical protein SAMN05414137_1256 [Streptacidiphilus jiangxiensis]